MKIFLSYRRRDSGPICTRIFQELSRIPDWIIYKDVDSTPIGVPFVKHITHFIAHSDISLILIGKSWLDIRDEKGSRRIDDPSDTVRLEIETSHQYHVTTIPVFINEDQPLTPEDLPSSLVFLLELPTLLVHEEDEQFRQDMQILATYLRKSFDAAHKIIGMSRRRALFLGLVLFGSLAGSTGIALRNLFARPNTPIFISEPPIVTKATVQWQTQKSGHISLALTTDGTRLIGASDTYAIFLIDTATGKQIWTQSLDKMLPTTLIADAAGIYVATSNLQLIAVAFDGTIRWQSETPNQLLSTPILFENSILGVFLNQRLIHYNSSSGKMIWDITLHNVKNILTLVADSLHIYVLASTHQIYAINLFTGTIAWISDPSYILADSIGALDNLVFANDNTGALMAFDAITGHQKWLQILGGSYRTFWLVTGSNMVFLVSNDGAVWAISPAKGTIIWHHQFTQSITAAPLYTGSSFVYRGKEDVFASTQMLLALSIQTGMSTWQYEDTATSLVGADNNLYFSESNGSIIAIKGNS